MKEEEILRLDAFLSQAALLAALDRRLEGRVGQLPLLLLLLLSFSLLSQGQHLCPAFLVQVLSIVLGGQLVCMEPLRLVRVD